MSEQACAADTELETFLKRGTPHGLFRRYCRARRLSLAYRLGAVVFCMIGALTVLDPRLALGLAGAMALMDLVDCAVLGRGAKIDDDVKRLRRWLWGTGLLAGVQTVSVVGFVLVVSQAAGGQGDVLAIALILSATLDASFYRNLHKIAWMARLAVLSCAICVILVNQGLAERIILQQVLLEIMGIGLLCLVAWMFSRQSLGARQRSEDRQLAALTAARDLAQTNEALKQSQEMTRRLGTVAERASDAILVTDTNQRIAWVNGAFVELTGFDAPAVLHRNLGDLPVFEHDASVSIARLQEAFTTQTPSRAELRFRRRNETTIWVDVVATPVFDSETVFESVIFLVRDISAAKEREAALAEARQAAEAAMHTKNVFLATMSHEIRTPMNGIIGTADLLSETALTEEQRGLVRTISQSGESLLTIVNDVLDVSALEAGRLGVSLQPFELQQCLRSTVGLVRPLAETRGLDLNVQWPEMILPPLIGDAGRLRQIIVNLLGNAIKFTPSGAVTLSVATHREADRCTLSIEVQDTGIGIAPDQIETIFDSFTQADETISGRFGGTGLGLSISRGLAEAMGGTLRARSSLGRGSSFTLTLDLAIAAADAAVEPSQEITVAESLSGHKILIAEDNRTNIMLLEKMLHPFEMHLVFATNGQEAVDLFDAHSPDLVFMDMRMPRLDGMQATQAIRVLESTQGLDRVPIVALTANSMLEDREKCAAAGMDDFLSKPFRKSDLVAAIKRHLGADASTHARASGA